ncbi:MAG: DoxX family protein [Polaromonas sp.]|nr:DoxX family protein [Polaromonas sp.]
MTPTPPGPMQALLRARWLYHVGAVILTFMYWGSGLSKALDFQGALGEMAHFGLNPPAAFAIATIIVQLGGSALLIIGGRWAWLGAGALAVFTLATIPVAHRFWEMTGDMAFMEKMVVFEHITVVGGLMLAAVAAELRRQLPRA